MLWDGSPRKLFLEGGSQGCLLTGDPSLWAAGFVEKGVRCIQAVGTRNPGLCLKRDMTVSD